MNVATTSFRSKGGTKIYEGLLHPDTESGQTKHHNDYSPKPGISTIFASLFLIKSSAHL